MKFIGITNYIRLLQDGVFAKAIWNNLILAFFCVVLQVGIAFVISSLLCTKMLKGKAFHQFAIFMPVILAPVVVDSYGKLFITQITVC